MGWGDPVSVRSALWLVLLTVSCTGGPGENGFATLENGSVMVDGKPFFPMVMNYQVNLVDDGSNMWPASYCGYNPDDRFRYGLPDSCILQLQAEMALMRELGFNTVRVTGFTEGPTTREGSDLPLLRIRRPNGKEEFINASGLDVKKRYLKTVDLFLDAAAHVGMKVILLVTIHEDRPGSKEHFIEVADHLRRNTTILAFDLFNEPLYFDLPPRSKKEVHRVVSGWRELANEHIPDHLITIGLTGIREVHAWDPNILDVDLISFHPYEYEPGQVMNEIRWYGQHVRKPWMIGETSLPADDDSVSFADMARFAQNTLEQTVACGGIGYSWWQFKDVKWGRFHSDHMGLLKMDGETPVEGYSIPVHATPKPAADVFRSFDPGSEMSDCVLLPNYLNYSQHDRSRLTGRLLDGDGQPIEGGVVLAWNKDFSHSYHTTTQQDGGFELLGDMFFHYWIASAVDHEMVRGDCPPSGARKDSAGTYSFFLGNLEIPRLAFSSN